MTAAAELAPLAGEIDALLSRLADAELEWQPWIERVADDHRPSAINLVHYWALRQTDLRDLQRRLAAFGLSSLGRSEAHVQSSLQLIAAAIAAMEGRGWRPPRTAPVDFDSGTRLLARNAEALLGPAAPDRLARIMVTLPAEAAADPDLVARLVAAGMGIARINCAHDDAAAWRAMAGHVRAAARQAGRTCLVAMDLAGPKLRTGPLVPGPKVVRLRPRRNLTGQVVNAARGWLTAADHPAPAPDNELTVVPVDAGWLARRHVGEELVLRDTRGSKRRLVLASAAPGGFLLTTTKTSYLGTGTVLRTGTDTAVVGELPPTEQGIRLSAGDVLRLDRDCTPARVDPGAAPRIGCTLPELFDNAAVGDRIFFDDGRLSGKVIAVNADHLEARIEHPSHGSVTLRAGKGINAPDTDLPISALTAKDLTDLATVIDIADLVDLSFVRESDDVTTLFDALARMGGDHLGLVLKIETQRAFEQLPQLILTAMAHPRVGVMIARGDLAVESGYERMAELQEETLWLCEAGHLPVIWATQVLEQLAKTGRPSRAEISDAAMSERAECVMLNKGPYICDAVVALDDILCRMADHHYKKSALLPRLRSWQMVDLD